MEFKLIEPEQVSSESVRSIGVGQIYFVTERRNAWHGTETNRFTSGCMHTTLAAAKAFAETQRKPGSCFQITRLPCLVLRSRTATVLITEINNVDVLGGYRGAEEKLALALKPTLREISLSFQPQSSYWIRKRSIQNSVLMFEAGHSTVPVEGLRDRNHMFHTSYTQGSNYPLGWRSRRNVSRASSIKGYLASRK